MMVLELVKPITNNRASENVYAYDNFVKKQLKDNSYMLAQQLQYKD